MARSLVDTNILVYSRDLNEPVKRTRAIEVIEQLRASGELVLSAQCLNEFSSTSLRRGMPISEVRVAVSRWHDLGQVLSLTAPATTAALAAVERYRLSFCDALIWATARDADVHVVLLKTSSTGRKSTAFASSIHSSRRNAVPKKSARNRPALVHQFLVALSGTDPLVWRQASGTA